MSNWIPLECPPDQEACSTKITNIHPKVKQSNNIEGYNLVLMSEEDQEKTLLVTS